MLGATTLVGYHDVLLINSYHRIPRSNPLELVGESCLLVTVRGFSGVRQQSYWLRCWNLTLKVAAKKKMCLREEQNSSKMGCSLSIKRGSLLIAANQDTYPKEDLKGETAGVLANVESFLVTLKVQTRLHSAHNRAASCFSGSQIPSIPSIQDNVALMQMKTWTQDFSWRA